MSETQIDGGAVIQWLTRAQPDEWSALVGCLVDDGRGVDAWTILAIAPNLLTVAPETAPGSLKTRPWTWLGSGILLVPADRAEVLALIERGRPADLVALDKAKARLRQHGFDPTRFATDDDVRHLDRIMAAWASTNSIPPEADRSLMYLAVEQAAQHKAAVRFFRLWCDAIEREAGGSYSLLGRLHLAVSLRRCAQPKQSLEVSAIVEEPWSRTASPQRFIGMLCNHRAAAMLDVREIDRDPAWLDKAHPFLNRAYAIAQSEEVSKTFDRWRALKRQMEALPSVPRPTLASRRRER